LTLDEAGSKSSCRAEDGSENSNLHFKYIDLSMQMELVPTVLVLKVARSSMRCLVLLSFSSSKLKAERGKDRVSELHTWTVCIFQYYKYSQEI